VRVDPAKTSITADEVVGDNRSPSWSCRCRKLMSRLTTSRGANGIMC